MHSSQWFRYQRKMTMTNGLFVCNVTLKSKTQRHEEKKERKIEERKDDARKDEERKRRR